MCHVKNQWLYVLITVLLTRPCLADGCTVFRRASRTDRVATDVVAASEIPVLMLRFSVQYTSYFISRKKKLSAASNQNIGLYTYVN